MSEAKKAWEEFKKTSNLTFPNKVLENTFREVFEAGQKAMIEVIKRMVEKHGSFDYFEEEFNDFVKEFEGDKDEKA